MISGTGSDGVDIYDNSSSNIVAGNKIGTDVSGSVALGNASNGVEVDAGCIGNTIGGRPRRRQHHLGQQNCGI